MSRLDSNPGNHGKKPCWVTIDELCRRIGFPENLSSNTLIQLLKVGKNQQNRTMMTIIIDKMKGDVETRGKAETSSFTLLPEGNY